MSDNNQCVIVGIAGASASGKSLIASTIYNELREKVGDHQIGVITEDCYYNDQSQLSMEERVTTNYDHPSALVGPEVAQRAVPSASCDMVWCAERAGSWLFSGYTYT